MNIEIATDIFMPMLLKRRSPSVFSWSSKRKLTCAMIFSLLENGVYCITNAFQCQEGANGMGGCFYSCLSCFQLEMVNYRLTRTRGSEKIAVRAGTGQFKDENVLMNLIDEQPVGRNMAFAVIGPVVSEGVVAVCRGQRLAIGEFGDDRMKPFDRHMPPQHQFVVALERRGVSDDILHFAKSFHICPRSVYVGWFGSCAMRSPSSIAAMVSAFGNGSAEMVKGMRFSRITVLMYTVITDDAERPTLSQKSTKRFLVGASSENVMFAIVFLHSFESKTRISYTKLTGIVKGAA